MSTPILIKNARCVSSKGIVKQDVLIRDGKIAQLGEVNESAAEQLIDGTHL
ncbi:MAG: dihydroorotase, partial [Candidatus Marinimicrobia bacterium]|nr:dihydroorotase [Candidatus Neomarinimicrobiota bacterium]